MKNKTDNKILILIDEAHLLIDRNQTETLLFCFQMVKRIRKYNGSIIFITQNINDFIGDDSIKNIVKE